MLYKSLHTGVCVWRWLKLVLCTKVQISRRYRRNFREASPQKTQWINDIKSFEDLT